MAVVVALRTSPFFTKSPIARATFDVFVDSLTFINNNSHTYITKLKFMNPETEM